MVESGVLSWIAPFRCSKRDNEIQTNLKPSSSTVQVENSSLKMAAPPLNITADVGSDLKLQWALQRRGIALDQCRILDWSQHEKWVHILLNTLTRESPDGYQRVKQEQLICAAGRCGQSLLKSRQALFVSTMVSWLLNAPFAALRTDPRGTFLCSHCHLTSKVVPRKMQQTLQQSKLQQQRARALPPKRGRR